MTLFCFSGGKQEILFLPGCFNYVFLFVCLFGKSKISYSSMSRNNINSQISKKKNLIIAYCLGLRLHLGRYRSRHSFLLLNFPSVVVVFNWRK